MDFILHLDDYLSQIVNAYGTLTYVILFAIVFAETGLVATPFLPGDSLLFAAGAIAAIGSLNVWLVVLLLFTAAVAGDTVNYWIGHFLGRTIVNNPRIPFINQEHIAKTEQFFKTYGGKTVILARFVPIVRTFAPFVAGIGAMDYPKFILYNVVGGAVWVLFFTLAGYFFGNAPFIKENFHYAIVAIVALSIVPMIYEYIRHKRAVRLPAVSSEKLKKIVNE
jgi:membrane-associated protein